MASKDKAKTETADREEDAGSTKEVLASNRKHTEAEDIMHRLAEELGRLFAQRLGNRRRGYGLLASLFGVAVCAVLMVVLFRWLMRG